jgi:hypothetical protein
MRRIGCNASKVCKEYLFGSQLWRTGPCCPTRSPHIAPINRSPAHALATLCMLPGGDDICPDTFMACVSLLTSSLRPQLAVQLQRVRTSLRDALVACSMCTSILPGGAQCMYLISCTLDYDIYPHKASPAWWCYLVGANHPCCLTRIVGSNPQICSDLSRLTVDYATFQAAARACLLMEQLTSPGVVGGEGRNGGGAHRARLSLMRAASRMVQTTTHMCEARHATGKATSKLGLVMPHSA